MDIKEIQNLIKFVAKSGASEVKLEMEDVKITIKTGGSNTETTIIQGNPMGSMQQMQAPAPVPAAPAASETPAAPAVDENAGYVTIKSPIIGTFYRKSPDKSNFVEVGSVINAGDTVCVIEAMKLFNEIESEISGKIVKVLVDDSSPVEYDQPLFLVDPS
jgi:acetyl-CoA carboxylase biotin carboxyl carrier protein